MMKAHIILAVTFVIASLAVTNSEAGYGRINDYLIKQVSQNDEIGPNMEAASNWLKELEGKKLPSLLAPVSDLKKFVALQQVVDDTKCDGDAYEIMRSNEGAVGSQLSSEEKGFRRVDKIIKKIFKDHGEKCDKVYPSRLLDLMEQLDAKDVESVRNLTKKILFYDRWYFRHAEEGLIYYHIRNSESIDHYAGEGYLRGALISCAGGDPDLKYLSKTFDERTGKPVVNKDKLSELAQKHIFKPCKHFTDALGPSLFIPARYNQRFIDHSTDLKNPNYYLNWTRFRICQLFIENEAAVLHDIKKSVAKGPIEDGA